ncbi:MAG: 50S ribosomal protein L24 [archaeon]
MKNKFSTHWNSSVQPRKQRKYQYNAPLHLRHKFLSAQLSKVLRQKYGKRNLPLRTGDEVLIMRGSFKKKKAKVSSVDHKTSVVSLEGIQRSKKDGTKVNVPFDSSNLQIQTLATDDKQRLASLNRKPGLVTQVKEIKETKPAVAKEPKSKPSKAAKAKESTEKKQ